ncbi:MAG: acylphosphatase [Candidatus Caldarchaeum sp.]
MARVAVRVKVYGRVQGVFFRSSMKDVADEVGVDGWVRNVEDGSVEAMVAGEKAKVEQLVEWCRRGPPMARVERIIVEEIAETEHVKGFHIKY